MSGKLGAVPRQLNTGAAMADDQDARRVITLQAACDGMGGGNIAAKLKASAMAACVQIVLLQPTQRAREGIAGR